MLGEPWFRNNEEFNRVILLDDIPELAADQDYQIAIVDDDRLEGSLDGVEGHFSCDDDCVLAYDPGRSLAGYHPVDGSVIFTPADETDPVIISTPPSREIQTGDYLSLGYWFYAPEDVEYFGAYDFGVFAGGGDPLKVTRLAALTGTATYTGDASGMYYTEKSSSRPHFGSFDADVELNADFGTASDFGTIEGKVHNFAFESDASSFPTEVRLEMSSERNVEGSNIFQSAHEEGGPVPGGWVFGDTSASADDSSWWGRWSGKLFGNGDATTHNPVSDVKHPSSIGGTFGATNGENGLAGSFGTYLAELFSLPWRHGIPAGQFTVDSGAIEEHGNVIVSCPSGGKACVVTVAQDGTAVYKQRGGKPVVLLARTEEYYEHFTQAPIVDLDDALHVGADVALSAGDVPSRGKHGEISVSYGLARDGVGADEVITYLSADAQLKVHELYPEGFLYRFGAEPPTVRVAEGATPEMISETERAVQLINAALPHDWQLQFSDDPGPAGIYRPSDGEILVEFAAHADWSNPNKPPANEAVGLATSWTVSVRSEDPLHPFIFETVVGQVWVDHERSTGKHRLETLVHELIHTLGRGHPDPDRFPDTIMNSPAEGPPGHVLHPLDREALLAVYSELDPSTPPDEIAEDLGWWAETSVHLRGDIDVPGGDVAFGVASRNGLAQPWAFGPTPRTNLADNRLLSETVSWAGRLLGLTPAVEPVGGAADLKVHLASLDGQLDFTELESWTADAAPGAVGTGMIWGDGDLGYTVGVHDNSFVQTGGDEGVVTGAFFGTSHEAMGGVVERTDLTASFGGTR